jgi:hypothetical protein
VFISGHHTSATPLDATNTTFLATYQMQAEDLPNPGFVYFNATVLDLAGNPAKIDNVTSGVPVTFGKRMLVCFHF